MVENIKISVSILPFGHMKLMFVSTGEKLEEKERPVYIEPRSTSIEKVEILYEDAKGYIMTKTNEVS